MGRKCPGQFVERPLGAVLLQDLVQIWIRADDRKLRYFLVKDDLVCVRTKLYPASEESFESSGVGASDWRPRHEKLTRKSDSSQPAAEMAVYLFDDWFDPIEAGLRDRVREFIQAMVEGELDAALMRPRYGRRSQSSSCDADGPVGVTGHRHGHRSRSLWGLVLRQSPRLCSSLFIGWPRSFGDYAAPANGDRIVAHRGARSTMSAEGISPFVQGTRQPAQVACASTAINHLRRADGTIATFRARRAFEIRRRGASSSSPCPA